MILAGKEDVFTWVLRAPTTLSQTQSTTYPISVRVYYLYNYSGFQQIAFVPTNYVGDAPTVYSSSNNGPLSVSVQTITPIRSLANQGVNFSLTVEINNLESGSVNYYNNSLKAYHLNEFTLTLPHNWSPLDNLSAWNVSLIGDFKTYKLSFDELQSKYYTSEHQCLDQTLTCEGSRVCCDCTRSNSTTCLLVNAAINNLWLIRGDKARVLLRFKHPDVSIPTIDIVQVKGDYGYEIDAKEFTGVYNINVRGD